MNQDREKYRLQRAIELMEVNPYLFTAEQALKSIDGVIALERELMARVENNK